MASRQELQTKFEELLGSRNVYYQAPGSTTMGYPCIKFSKKKIKHTFANNAKYLNLNCYEVIVISKLPDHPVINKILELPYSSYDRPYVSDGLNHDVITLYY